MSLKGLVCGRMSDIKDGLGVTVWHRYELANVIDSLFALLVGSIMAAALSLLLLVDHRVTDVLAGVLVLPSVLLSFGASVDVWNELSARRARLRRERSQAVSSMLDD